MGNYNANYPTVLGNELAPVALDPVTIDTGSSFGYTFTTADVTAVRTARVMMTAPPPGQARRKVLTVEVYRNQGAPSTGRMKKVLVPCTSGANITGTAVTGGAATYQDGLNNPTDLKGILFTGPSAACRLWFDTNVTNNPKLHALLSGSRIMDVTVRYAVAGQFNVYNNPISLSLERPSTSTVLLMDDSLVGGTSIASGTVPRRSRLGDYNPLYSTTIDPNTDMKRAPWVSRNAIGFTGLESFQFAGGTNINVRFDTIAGIAAGANAFTLHYCALEITYCAEGRLAAGGYDLTTGVSIDNDLNVVDVPLFSIASGNGFPWNSAGGQDALLAVGQAVVGATSQTFPMPVAVDRVVPSRETFRGHRGVVLRKTIRLGEEWTREDEVSVPAVAMYSSTSVFDSSTIYTPSQVYVAQLSAPITNFSSGNSSTYATIIDDTTGRTYTQVRFYARKLEGTAPGLTVRQTNSSDVALGPYAYISVEDFEALPEIVDGWKEVTLTLSAPVVSASSGTFRWAFRSTTGSAFPWEILGADSNPYRETAGAYGGATYGSSAAFARVQDSSDLGADYAVMMVQAMPTPTGFTVSPAVQPVTVVDEYCGLPVDAMPTGIRYFELDWNPVNDLSVAGFGYYEVQRRDTTMEAGVWETVAEVSQVTTTAAADYEARIGVETRYRLRTVHEDGYTSAWTSEVAVTIAAPGVTGTAVDAGVLLLTSNQNPDSNLAYTMAWDGSGPPEQAFTFPEGDAVKFTEMYGRDFRTAYHPTERGGVTFTRTLMVNAAGVPSGTLDSAARALRDLAWEQLPYVCVRDERHNRWLTALTVPSAAARDVARRGHLVLVPVTFTEVTATPAPVDYDVAVCEGILRSDDTGSDYWSTAPPAVLNGTRTVTDTFTRTVSSGWGTADLGGATTASGGSATDFNTTGTTGTILTGSTAVDRRVLYAPTLAAFYRAHIEFTVPAVATGATYTVAMIVRYIDANNYYLVRPTFLTTGQFRIDIVKVAAGVTTTLTTGANIDTYTTGTKVFLDVFVQGGRILARAYRTGDPLPSWTDTSGEVVQAFDTTVGQLGRWGVQQTRQASNTNTTLTITYDNFTIDTLPTTYDMRMKVRPVGDIWGATFALDPFGADMEGGWAFDITSVQTGLLTYGRDFTEIVTSKMALLGIVRNRLTWVRYVVTQDNGSGVMSVQFYTLADNGVTWTLVDTVTGGPPQQPFPPGPPDAALSVSAWQGEIWVEKWEVYADGTLIANPDFAAQSPGTTSFTDGKGNLWETDGEAICADLA